MAAATEIMDAELGVPIDRAFVAYCRRGQTDSMQRCLDLGIPAGKIELPTIQEGFKRACSSGRMDAIKLLLGLKGDRRVDVHAGNEEAFRNACREGHLEIVKLLLALEGDRRVDVHAADEDGFIAACSSKHMEVLKLLLSLTGDRAANVHAQSQRCFMLACGGGNLELLKLLLALDGDQRIDVSAVCVEALGLACQQGRLYVVKLLLSLPADRAPSLKGFAQVGFKLAVKKHHWAVVKYLLTRNGGTAFDWVSIFLQVSDSKLGTSLAPALEGVSKDRWPSGLVAAQVMLEVMRQRVAAEAAGTEETVATSDDLMALRVLAVCGCMPAAGCSELGAWLGSVDQDMQVSAAGSLGSLLAGWTADVSWCSVSTPSEGGDMEA